MLINFTSIKKIVLKRIHCVPKMAVCLSDKFEFKIFRPTESLIKDVLRFVFVYF